MPLSNIFLISERISKAALSKMSSENYMKMIVEALGFIVVNSDSTLDNPADEITVVAKSSNSMKVLFVVSFAPLRSDVWEI